MDNAEAKEVKKGTWRTNSVEYRCWAMNMKTQHAGLVLSHGVNTAPVTWHSQWDLWNYALLLPFMLDSRQCFLHLLSDSRGSERFGILKRGCSQQAVQWKGHLPSKTLCLNTHFVLFKVINAAPVTLRSQGNIQNVPYHDTFAVPVASPIDIRCRIHHSLLLEL